MAGLTYEMIMNHGANVTHTGGGDHIVIVKYSTFPGEALEYWIRYKQPDDAEKTTDDIASRIAVGMGVDSGSITFAYDFEPFLPIPVGTSVWAFANMSCIRAVAAGTSSASRRTGAKHNKPQPESKQPW